MLTLGHLMKRDHQINWLSTKTKVVSNGVRENSFTIECSVLNYNIEFNECGLNV